MKKKNTGAHGFSVFVKNIIARLSANMRRPWFIAVVIGACFVIASSAFVLNRVLVRAEIDNLLKNTEILVRYDLWDYAAETLGKAIAYDSKDKRSLELLATVGKGFINSAEQSEKSYEYGTALDLYKKANAIAKADSVTMRISNLEYTIGIPKLFIEGKPCNALINRGGESWDKSFSRTDMEQAPESSYGIAPGNVLRFKMTSEADIENLTLELINEKGKRVASNKGFAMKRNSGGYSWYCLVGIPSTLAAKKYSLSGRWIEPDGKEAAFYTDLPLDRRAFPEETITLNPQLSNLVSVPDKQKTAERLRVAEILGSFNPKNIFQSDCFMLPADGCLKAVSTFYGERLVFVYSTGGGYTSVHDGIDFALVTGTPVHATAKGSVVLARKHIVSGNTIIIEHLPSVYSVYYHLSKIIAKEGDIVPQGQLIAEIGSTGLSTGAHLHFSLFVGGIPVDPEFFTKNKPLY
jgi:murein DD-endopeptidase MepM/ murein hydrolase activator NlpD